MRYYTTSRTITFIETTMNKKDALSALKALRRKNREDEIRLHGKPLPRTIVERNRKQYTRKQKHKKRPM